MSLEREGMLTLYHIGQANDLDVRYIKLAPDIGRLHSP